MDKPRYDYCENYCYGPEGHYCLLWNCHLRERCYSDSVCDSRNQIYDDEPHEEDELRYGRH